MYTIPYGTARQHGFPARPRPGQKVVDSNGTVWQWFGDDSGLSDLGFWGALIGLGTSLVGGLFGKGKDKKQLEQAQQIIQQQQAELDAMKAKQSEGGLGINKKTLLLIGVGLLAFMAISR